MKIGNHAGWATHRSSYYVPGRLYTRLRQSWERWLVVGVRVLITVQVYDPAAVVSYVRLISPIVERI